MKITEIKVKFDNGGLLDFQYPGGFAINDIPKVLGLSSESLVSAEKGTVKHALFGFLNIVSAVLLKRIGL